MADGRERRQLELIHEFASLAEGAGIEYRLRGGWALDSLLGHLGGRRSEAPRQAQGKRIRRDRGPPPEQQRNLVKDGEALRVALLERNELGLVTAGGRWGDVPWPKGMLEGPIGQIGDVRCRVVSPEARMYAKTEVPHALSHPQRERDHADTALPREAVAAERTRRRQ